MVLDMLETVRQKNGRALATLRTNNRLRFTILFIVRRYNSMWTTCEQDFFFVSHSLLYSAFCKLHFVV